MSFILTSRTRDRQPQGGIARVNPSGIAANGLNALFDLSSGRELISGVGPTTVPVERNATATGVGAKFAASGQLVYAHRPAFAITGDITIVAFVDVVSYSNYSAIISKQASSTTHCPYEMRLGGGAAGAANIQILRAGGSLDAMDGFGGLSSPKPGMLVSAGHSVSAGVNRYCYDGDVQNVTGRSTATPTDNTSSVIVASRQDGFTRFSGTMFWIALFARFLAADELVALKQRPWQLFAPERRPVFYSLPAAGGTSSAVVWNSRTRTRQPRRFARADTGRLPITHLWSGSAGAGTFIPDAAGTAHGTKGTLVAGQGYSIKPTGDSVVIEFDTSVGGANSQIINLGDASGSGGPRRLTAFTLFMEFMVPSIAQAVFYSGGAGGLQFSLESGGILNLVKSNIAVIGVASTAVATTNVWHKAAVSYDGTNYQFVLNGAAAGSGSNAVTISPVQQYFGGLVVGSDSYGAPPNGSKLKTLAILNKVCSVEEMSRLCANPWQLFAPERRPVFYSIAGVSPGPSTANRIMLLRRPGLSRVWR